MIRTAAITIILTGIAFSLLTLTVFADSTVTIVIVGTPGPDITITSPTSSSNQPISGISIQAISETSVDASNISVSSSSTATYTNFSCEQTSSTEVNCTITVTNSGDLIINAVDSTGTSSATASYVIHYPASSISSSSSSSTSSQPSSSATSSASESSTTSSSTSSSGNENTSSSSSSQSTSSHSSSFGSSRPPVSTPSQVQAERIVAVGLVSAFTLTATPIVVIATKDTALMRYIIVFLKRLIKAKRV